MVKSGMVCLSRVHSDHSYLIDTFHVEHPVICWDRTLVAHRLGVALFELGKNQML